jgi:hypothetical protein
MTRVIATLILIVLATNLSGGLVDFAPQRGRAIAAINWTDETGRTRPLSEFAGYPLILLPIYTRCRSSCVQNVNRLKEALAEGRPDLLYWLGHATPEALHLGEGDDSPLCRRELCIPTRRCTCRCCR